MAPDSGDQRAGAVITSIRPDIKGSSIVTTDCAGLAAFKSEDYRRRLFTLLSDRNIRRGRHAGYGEGHPGARTSFRLGYALTLVSTACYVAVAGLFYQLFKPVSRSIALLAAFFGLVGCAITAVQSIFQLAPFAVQGGGYSSVLDAKQLQALAQMLLDMSAQAGYVALVFFGVFQLLNGYLIFKSAFLPRILGVLMALGGLGWLTFLSPPFANYLLIALQPLGILAEAPLMLWLVVFGVNSQRWKERADAGRPALDT